METFYFYFLTLILKRKICAGCMASQEALRALVLYLGHSWRNMRRSDWRLKLEKDLIGWLITFFFSLIGCRC